MRRMSHFMCLVCIFFFNDTATTEIYTLSLHDALPISDHVTPVHALGQCRNSQPRREPGCCEQPDRLAEDQSNDEDRKSTRLNSSHANISYAVFCLKKKKKKIYFQLSTSDSSHQINNIN